MRGIVSAAIVMCFSASVNSWGNDHDARELKLGEYSDQAYSPFFTCGPKDECVELPDVPYAWRFIPEFMGFRKFTPVGAIRKDWNDWWLSRKRGWWDWTNTLTDVGFNGRGFSGYSNGWGAGYNDGFTSRRHFNGPLGRLPGYPNWYSPRRY